MQQQTYNVGIYARLSREDEREGDSVSIETQKQILLKHVREQGWHLADIYADDGYTGGNFDRPDFQRLIADVQSGKINLVLVKDLSRFGRNYIELGQYTEVMFPRLGCRFVALHDGVDTGRGDNDIMPFKNLFNEFYLRDCSRKAKASKKSMAERGRYTGSYAPYGYAIAQDGTHRLVVDEDAAPIVRRIFSLRRQGYGPRRIAGLLNGEQIPPPSAYRRARADRRSPPGAPAWNCTTVSAMLSNEAYIGNLVQRKEETLSYKSKHRLKNSEEDWVRAENTHEPIIDRPTWDACMQLAARAQKTRSGRAGEPHLFAGLLFCGDCGCGLRANIDRRSGGGSCVRYVCGRYQTGGRAACSIHSVREEALRQLLREDIQRRLPGKTRDEEAIRQLVLKRLRENAGERHRADRARSKQLQSRLEELAQIVCSLYEDKALGRIPEQSYREMIDRYHKEQEAKIDELRVLERKLQSAGQDRGGIGALAEAVKRRAAGEELDRAILLALIGKIVVGEKQEAGGRREQRIEIFYRSL